MILQLEQLKNSFLPRMTVEELIVLHGGATDLIDGYTDFKLDAPEWLQARVKELAREVNARRRDVLALKLRQAKARRETLKPDAEKRTDLDKQIAQLEVELAE